MHKSSKLVEANPLSLLQHERNYRNHLTRLLDISVSKGSLSNRQKNINDHDVRLQKNQEFQRRKQNRRLLEIEKDNAKLLLKIMEINIGKRTSKSQPKIPTLVLETDRSVVQQENSPRGNSNRKKEYTRIENENKKLSERLVLQESSFAKERMNREYQQNREYSSRLRKVRISSDNILEVGQGAVKFSKDLRITSHTPYLPALNPISSHTYRASSVSRVNTDTSCRSATKGTVSVISARNREKALKTEIDTSENAIKSLARCQSSPNYKFLVQENGSATDRVYGRNSSPFQKKVKGSPVKGSPVKYRQGEFIFDTKKDGSVAEGIIKARSSQSKREQGEEMLIREESQAKEESLQRSRLENYESRNLSEVGRKGLVKGKEERQVTEEYEQIYEAESRYESKTNNAKIECRSNRETEGYPEDYESLVESVKAEY